MVCLAHQPVRYRNARRSSPSDFGRGSRRTRTPRYCHLWRETGAHHLRSACIELYRNSHFHKSASFGRTKVSPSELTLTQLNEEQCRNIKYTLAARPLPHFTREDETKLAPIQKVKTISPVPVAISIDGVDMKFDAEVVLEGHFPQRLYLGRQELRCYNVGLQNTQGEARIDERASLVHTLQEPIPLYGMIDTGFGVSILSLSAYQKIASTHALSLLPYDIQLYAANGKTINTIGIAENVNFQLGGHTLETNFIVIADHLGAEDFLLGRTVLPSYNVLVDLTAMRVTIRDPKAPRQFKPIHEVSDHEPSLVISTEKVVLGPFERKLVSAHNPKSERIPLPQRNDTPQRVAQSMSICFRKHPNFSGGRQHGVPSRKKPDSLRKFDISQ